MFFSETGSYSSLKISLLVLLVIITAGVAWFTLRKPSNDRDWAPDQKILSYADFNDNLVTVYNVRNNTYRTTEDYDVNYYDKTYDLNKIKKVYYVVEPFSALAGPAHTFLSFEFENNQYVSISVEVRKRKGEQFNEILSALNYYELMYVVADENDVVKLRSNYRHDLVFMYPMRGEKEDLQKLFVDYLQRANKLKDQPEFYNLFYNTCTTNILDHVNKLRYKPIPYNLSIFLPSYSDKLAFDNGLIDTDKSFEETRNTHFINQRAKKFADSPNFSALIRDITK